MTTATPETAIPAVAAETVTVRAAMMQTASTVILVLGQSPRRPASRQQATARTACVHLCDCRDARMLTFVVASRDGRKPSTANASSDNSAKCERGYIATIALCPAPGFHRRVHACHMCMVGRNRDEDIDQRAPTLNPLSRPEQCTGGSRRTPFRDKQWTACRAIAGQSTPKPALRGSSTSLVLQWRCRTHLLLCACDQKPRQHCLFLAFWRWDRLACSELRPWARQPPP